MIFNLHTVICAITLNGKHAVLFKPGHCTRQFRTMLKIMNGCENNGIFFIVEHEATLEDMKQFYIIMYILYK